MAHVLACWITEAIYIHSEYVVLISFPMQQWLRERPQRCVVHILPVLLSDIPEKYPDKAATASFRVLSHLPSPVTLLFDAI
jgi:hypothetical protein